MSQTINSQHKKLQPHNFKTRIQTKGAQKEGKKKKAKEGNSSVRQNLGFVLLID